MERIMRQTISLDRELHKEIKLICVKNEITMNDLVDKIIGKFLSTRGENDPLDI
jgi:predicted DNA-binding ribbon-helix-helix protein